MPAICLITTCKGRLAHLKRSLPAMAGQEDVSVVVVDYDCPERCGDWVAREFPGVRVVREHGRDLFNVSHARNLGAAVADAPWLCFVDADVILAPDFSRALAPLLTRGRYYRPLPRITETCGTVVCAHADFVRAGGYDEAIKGWGGEDTDFYHRLQMLGVSPSSFPAHLIEPLLHGDEERMRHYEVHDKKSSQMAIGLYVRAKTDMMKLTGAAVSADVRQALFAETARIMREVLTGNQNGRLEVGLGQQTFGDGEWVLESRLTLSVRPTRFEPREQQAVGARPPIPFIVGSGRCGTTLLRLMLDRHPELAIPYETHFIPALATMWQVVPNPVAVACNRIVGDPRWPSWGLDAQALRDALARIPHPTLAGVLRTFYALSAQRFGKPRAGDKTALYVWEMATIADHLPEARFIHVIRDGRDVALSFRGLWWGPQTVPEAAAWWATAIETARAFPCRDRYLEVRYEDLVREPEPVLRRICEFIELPWSPALLDHAAAAAERLGDIGDMPMADGRVVPAERIRAIHAKTRGPLDASGIGRWRTEMTPAEKRQFALMTGPLLKDLGYDLA